MKLIHRKCSGVTLKYIENKLNISTFMCKQCIKETFPFNELNDFYSEEFNSNYNCKCNNELKTDNINKDNINIKKK